MRPSLADVYLVNRHYQRAKRLDSDLVVEGLEGYKLNQTAWHVLNSFSQDIASSNQRAFTWTGPYGSGKSSLALLLCALLSAKGSKLQKTGVTILGGDRASEFYRRLPLSKRGWLIVRVVGSRGSPIEAIGVAVDEACKQRWGGQSPVDLGRNQATPDNRSLVKAIQSAAIMASEEGDGILILVDEMGKFLEFAAKQDGDLFVFQEIAELLGRLHIPCAFLGVLHQSFDEYARRSSREARAEWSKIQGRFTDAPFSIAIEEVITLIASAIVKKSVKASEVQSHAKKLDRLAANVAKSLGSGRFSKLSTLSATLAACAPLHPVAALLLGPISRRRFGQNERSVFSFLSSNEPHSFGDFLRREPSNSSTLYTVENLWDYLQLNHEPTILASPDGARWAVASESVLRVSRRAEATEHHVSAMKTVALLDLFGNAFGIGAANNLVQLALEQPGWKAPDVPAVLSDLKNWSAIIERRHAGGWGVFAGSDIDIESEAEKARSTLRNDIERVLGLMPELPPVVAKRHYAQTGTMRVFERNVYSSTESLTNSTAASLATGRFCLIVADDPISDEEILRTRLENTDQPTVLLAFISRNHSVVERAVDVAALERVQATVPQLSGDPVARRELNARLSLARNDLAEELGLAFNNVDWKWHTGSATFEAGIGLSAIASAVCDATFSECPRVVNELLNREKPSSSAVAARRRLAQAMIQSPTTRRVGIEAEPAELGLYLSVLEISGIHSESTDGAWKFQAPTRDTFRSMWDAAYSYLKSNGPIVRLDEVYQLWKRPPFGIRSGLLPIFALSLMLANDGSLAIYVEDTFTTKLDDVVVDRMLQSPEEIGLRWVGDGEISASTLENISRFIDQMGLGNQGVTALEVTKPLVQFAHRLPGWVRRTHQLKSTTKKLRDYLIEARDPYTLLLHDLPEVCGKDGEAAENGPDVDIEKLSKAIEELRSRQAELMEQFREALSRSLNADLSLMAGRQTLAQRAKIVATAPECVDLRTKRFAQVLSECAVKPDWLESICGLAAGRPLKDWSDPDIGRTVLELTGLSEQFGQVEAAITVTGSQNTQIQKVTEDLLSSMTKSKLDTSQQRMALLYALRLLGEKSKAGKAA